MSTTPNTQPIPSTPSTPLTNLHHLYKDITLLSQIASPTITLHPADRALVSPPRAPLVGIDAAQQHEESLVQAAAARGGKLVFRPESIQVDGRGVFGVVLGVLEGRLIGIGASGDGNKRPGEETSEGGCEGKGRKEGEIEMAFCGVWRFDEMGRAVEHWENAADPAALGRWLQGK
ncbi:hypothetical protein B0J18DRAFT_463240 [Chaetomium sp. MPI-SDFR-AT-0129]|nr:hypothetical protein B0J18DRAFT_463240 [Chaetomium sp. MPI-SDFR-AT-0129]